jgi:A/G-specific adenine glycosylase
VIEETVPPALQRFSVDIVQWQKGSGRNHLPWQNTRDPYRVWLSEIMLQQTQVATVLGYYSRFLQRFPAVADLAEATLDDVLTLWSGLGYYSRARNMHRCAQQVLALHGGKFPSTAKQLESLPGIGPSTAAAIASFCFAERVAILDGNVKRVLTRILAFAGDLSTAANERKLWRLATGLLPREHLFETMPRYTQGVMDLGATVCLAKKPRCDTCPASGVCLGLASGEPEKYPVKSRKIKRSSQTVNLLWAEKPDGSVWLERRPSAGIWGGLYCLPVFETEDALVSLLPVCAHIRLEYLLPFKHVLTHKDMNLCPVKARFSQDQAMLTLASAERDTKATGGWFAPGDLHQLGLPAPIRKLLVPENPIVQPQLL